MRPLCLALAATLLAGCSSIELAEAPTQPVDLNGEWVLDLVASESPGLVDPGLREERLDRAPRSRRELRRLFAGSGLAFIAHDFHVLRADRLEIEQGDDSLGIRYYPGIYRDVSWGERERGLWGVYAGWQENDMMIISTATDMKVIERFDLVTPATLHITVSITADGDQHEISRVYDRKR